jgi:hypothetical protein
MMIFSNLLVWVYCICNEASLEISLISVSFNSVTGSIVNRKE